MKNIIKTILYLQMTAMLFSAALAGPGAAEKQVPFRGSSVTRLETIDIQFPTMFLVLSSTGHATHFGQFTATWTLVVDLLTSSSTGSGEFIAANGDSISTKIAGQGFPTENPDVALLVEVHTITGGTGRFAGATGEFTVERFIPTISPSFTEDSFEGTISY